MDHDDRLTHCPFCRSESIKHYDTDYIGNGIFRCCACGAMFMNPQYSDLYLDEFYSRYTGTGGCDEGAVALGDRVRYQVHHHYLSLVERHVGAGRLLAVGCGDGFEISVAKERGWLAEGYDVDPKTTAAVSQRLGVEVRSGDFLDIAYPQDHFDCVYLHQVLEHPKNPRDYLAKIYAILRPGGIAFIACPNIGSLSSRLKTIAGKLGLKKRRGRHYDSFHHIFYYSPGSLGRILERVYGFQVVHVENGMGHKARVLGFSESRIKREIWCNRFLPCWKDVFVLLAARPK